MAKRKKSKKQSSIGIGVVIIAIAFGYAVNNYNKSHAQTEKPPVAEVEDTIVENVIESSDVGGETQEIPKSKAKAGQQRAKGIEIPAYLTDRDEEIVIHEGFTLSYNKKHLVPNWVAWVLKPERNNGPEKRANNFQPDLTIKKGPIAYDSDYRGSGYDRGHMCPSADNKHTREAMNQCFLFSNMCPQTHTLNAGDWAQLETLCRKWAVAYDSIYIVCGPIIEKGETYETIGENKVLVPKQFYKVILRWTGPNSAEAIGFIMNNDDSDLPIDSYAVTVDSVETRTGINFFSKLPKDVERRAEATFDCTKWKNLVKK